MNGYSTATSMGAQGHSAARLDQGLAARCPMRILVVDDNAVNQKVAVRMLERFGYRPAVAADGLEAVEAVTNSGFDLILMDVQMPNMDGLEATTRIRQLEAAKHVIIIAMTANAMKGDRETCLAAGMDDYLSKPVQPAVLQAMLERWGAQFAQQTENGAAHSAPNESPEAADAPVEVSRLIEFTDGTIEDLRELLQFYLDQTELQLNSLMAAFAAGIAADLRKTAHSVAGSSATCGMHRFAGILRQIEYLGADGDVAGAAGLIERADQEFKLIRQYVETYLASRAQPA